MIHYLIFGAVFWAIICRARLMTPSTPLRARLQHWVALVLAGASVPVVSSRLGLTGYEVELMGAALCCFVLFDARRHRPLTTKWAFEEVEACCYKWIAGGRK